MTCSLHPKESASKHIDFVKMRYPQLLACLSLVALSPVEETDAARILGLMFFHGRSHFSVFGSLMRGLAARGHQVTMVGHFPQKKPIANYTDVSLEGSLPDSNQSFGIEQLRGQGHFEKFDMFWSYQIGLCEAVLEHPNVQKLIKSNETFDLVFTHLLGVDCMLGFAHRFDAPLVSLMTSVPLPWGNSRIGNVDHPAYVPNYFLPYTDRMSFWQRVVNTAYYVETRFGHYVFSERPCDVLTRKHFGPDVPPLSELKMRTSIVLVNSHFSISTPRPTVPALVEVAGLHLSDGQELSQDIQDFLNGATNGVVYFSLGSMLQSETFPREKLKAFIDVFSRLPQRVVWKITNISGLSENVKCATWFSQLEILKHPNVRAFITHGGLLGTQEALYAGVPMLGIPIAFDQELNMKIYVSRGVAVQLDYESISEDTLWRSLNELLNDPRYTKNAKYLSLLFRDRPRKALDTAIYWTEYVIRHRGAPHLRSAAVDLNWYQYLLLDVVLVLLLSFVSVTMCVYIIFVRTMRKVNTFIASKRLKVYNKNK